MRVPVQQPQECGHLQRSDSGVLTVRWLILALVICSYPILGAQQEEPQATRTDEAKSQADKNAPASATKKERAPDKTTKTDDKDDQSAISSFLSWGGGIYRETIGSAEKLFTFFVAVFTLFAAIFTGLIYCEALQRGKKELRAYVSIVSTSIKDWNETNRPMAHLIMRNGGRTWAKWVQVFGYMHICEFPLTSELPIVPVEQRPDISKMVLGPGGERDKEQHIEEAPFGNRRPLSVDEIADLNESRKAIYVYGEISYRDIFGGHQITQYRYFANGKTVKQRPGKLVAHHSGNDAT